MKRFVILASALALVLEAPVAAAAVLRVPGDYATIQEAVDRARAGDTVEVATGRWCGARITKRLTLVGRGDAVIVGAKDGVPCGPDLLGTHRVGFFLASPDASGTVIRHFTFDGSAVATDSAALALAVFGRGENGTKVDDVVIEHTKVRGTLQPFTNRGGDNWVIRHNDIRGYTANQNGVGGFGIVVIAQPTASGVLRPVGNSVVHNRLETEVPRSFNSGPYFPGVFVGGAERTEVSHNRFELTPPEEAAEPSSPPPPAGTGVLVTEAAGLGSRHTAVTHNDGRESDYVLVVTGTGGANTVGLEHSRNLGTTLVEGEEVATGGRRDGEARTGKGRRGRSHDREDRAKERVL